MSDHSRPTNPWDNKPMGEWSIDDVERAIDMETSEPEWSDAEHDEIMRLHVVDGLTISEAKLLVFERRQDGGEPR